MSYSVKITNYAVGQMRDIIAYISNDLRSPESADRWADMLEKEISGLDMFPKRFPIIEKEPWKTKKIRRMIIKNFKKNSSFTIE